MIGIDEFEDAVQLLEDQGFRLDEFEVEEHSHPTGSGIEPITGAITWTHKTSGVSRTYSVGHASTWLMTFENDLRRNAYRLAPP